MSGMRKNTVHGKPVEYRVNQPDCVGIGVRGCDTKKWPSSVLCFCKTEVAVSLLFLNRSEGADSKLKKLQFFGF